MDRSTKTALGIAIILLLAAGGLYSYVYYTIKETNESILHISQEIESQSQKEEAVLELKRMYDTTQELRDSFNELLVREEDIVSFLGRLETVGALADTSFEITDVRLTNARVEEEENRQVLEVRAMAQGAFQNLFHLQTLLEHMSYEVVISRVAFNRTSGEAPQPWQATFTLQVHSYVSE